MTNWLHDKDVVKRVLKSYRDVMFSEENLRKSEERLNPGKPDLVVQMTSLWWEVGQQALEVNGIDPNVLATNAFIPELVMEYWGADPELLVYFDYLRTKGKPTPDWLKVGDKRPDIELVAMETKDRIPISRLHLDTQKYMVIVDGGALQRLQSDFQDKAEILFVYLREAHEKEVFNIGRIMSFLSQHKDIDDRIGAARALIDIDSSNQTFTTDVRNDKKVRMLVDDMSNTMLTAYPAYPVRAFAFEKDEIAFIGSTMVAQMKNPTKLITDEVREWLEMKLSTENKS
ncbi:type I iodothyronine deiodinase-like [Glandiceps talaboti]